MWYEKLYPEQRTAFDFIVNAVEDGGGAGLFSEQGTGKTIISLAVLEHFMPDTVLITCPLTAVDVTWVPRLETLPYSIHKTWESFKAATGKRILIVHFQLLSKIIKKIHKFAWEFALWDESQSAKGRSSGWSRAARRLRRMHRRLALSGTPIDKSPIDVWAQMRFIDHTVLGERWGDFADEYCRRGGYMNKKWVFRESKLPQFLNVLEPYIFRLSAKFLNLPPMHIHLVPVELFGYQRRMYEAMTEHSLIKLEDGTVIKADLPITRLAKQEQIVNGFIYDDDRNKCYMGQAKLRALKRIAAQLDSPIVVCCKFLEDIQKVCDALYDGGKHLCNEVLWGKNRVDRPDIIRRFQAGEIDALVVQIRTGGVSVEFTRAKDLIIYSMGHSYIDFDQFLKRLMRHGQTQEVNVYLIYAVNTVDEEKVAEIERKGREANLVVSHFERKTTMAKPATKKKVAKKATVKKVKKAAAKKAAFTIEDAAKILDVKPSTARMKFRNAGVPKRGAAYEWEFEKDLKADCKRVEA